MSAIVCTLQGRFGNQVMQWLFAYAFAQKHDLEFQCEEWVGERIFTLPAYGRPDKRERRRMHEQQLVSWSGFHPGLRPEDVEFRGYAQMQICADHYTKRDAQRWLKLRPEIETACANAVLADKGTTDKIVCHRRVGDYVGYSYPVVSLRSYKDACARFGLMWDSPDLTVLNEEDPTPHTGFLPDDLDFLPDFYRMMVAPTLLRANSSFSWLAALLGDGLVLSPVIDGLVGGREHDCAFVAGNHPRFVSLDFVTDLYVSP